MDKINRHDSLYFVDLVKYFTVNAKKYTKTLTD